MRTLFIFFIAVAAFFSCQKAELSTADKLKGEWSYMAGPSTAQWSFSFDGKRLEEKRIADGSVFFSRSLPYAVKSDTVFVEGDISTAPRKWAVLFECDGDIAQIRAIGTTIGGTFWIKRR